MRWRSNNASITGRHHLLYNIISSSLPTFYPIDTKHTATVTVQCRNEKFRGMRVRQSWVRGPPATIPSAVRRLQESIPLYITLGVRRYRTMADTEHADVAAHDEAHVIVSLGDRMKSYEAQSSTKIDSTKPYLIRLDGAYTRHVYSPAPPPPTCIHSYHIPRSQI
jgi:hypothetical protein